MIDALELLVLLANLGLVGGQVPRQVLSMMFCFSERLVGEEQRQFQSSVDLPIFTVVFFHFFSNVFLQFQQVLLGISICQAYVQALWTLAASRGLAVNSKGNKMRSAAVARLL